MNKQRKSNSKFELIQACDNLIDISPSKIPMINNGVEKTKSVLDMFTINHITNQNVMSIIKAGKMGKYIEFGILDGYQLPITYNKQSKKSLINIGFFHTTDISSSKPTDRQLYSCVTYSLIFHQLVNQKVKLSLEVGSAIINYYTSMFLSLFGKQYGLIGIYTNKIPKLKFLIACYVYANYFSMSGKKLFLEARAVSGVDINKIEDQLYKFDFSKIGDFVKSLDTFDVFSGFNIYKFMSRVYNSFGISFLAAFEDINRLIPSMMICNIGGNDIIPAFIYKYNIKVFNSILTLNKILFRGM